MSCKQHPDYDPSSGEPEGTLTFFPLTDPPPQVPCPNCWKARAKWLEKREAVLREALNKAQEFIEERCNDGAEYGWRSMNPTNISELWQILEAALEVK